jgi:hypothetical protein
MGKSQDPLQGRDPFNRGCFACRYYWLDSNGSGMGDGRWRWRCGVSGCGHSSSRRCSPPGAARPGSRTPAIRSCATGAVSGATPRGNRSRNRHPYWSPLPPAPQRRIRRSCSSRMWQSSRLFRPNRRDRDRAVVVAGDHGFPILGEGDAVSRRLDGLRELGFWILEVPDRHLSRVAAHRQHL